MKIVQSQGGPLIGLSEGQTAEWQGVFGKSFARSVSQYSNDYETACYENEQEAKGPWNIALFHGKSADAFLLSLPCRTALISSGDLYALIAQIEFSDGEWSFEHIDEGVFDRAAFDEGFEFTFDGSQYLLFDAARSGDDVGDDHLTFRLSRGLYRVEGGLYQPNEGTSLVLCRITLAR